MDEQEFCRLLDLFPVVRSRDYRAESDKGVQSASQLSQEREEWHDAWNNGDQYDLHDQETDQEIFWEKLKKAAEKKVGKTEAERFCKAFQRIHNKLVYEELNPEAARRFLNS